MSKDSANVLFVVTGHTALGDTGRKTGYYLSEVAHPWHELTEAGYSVDFVSPQGGPVEMDPESRDLDDPVNQAFWEIAENRQALQATRSPGEVDAGDYDAIFFAGGHGTMWDLPDSAPLAKLTAAIWEDSGAVSSVCHGPAGLVNVKLSDGQYLVDGKEMAAFTNDEERAAELQDTVPFLLQSKLEKRGAQHIAADNWSEHVVVDGRLITGQNPASAQLTGKKLVEFLNAQ